MSSSQTLHRSLHMRPSDLWTFEPLGWTLIRDLVSNYWRFRVKPGMTWRCKQRGILPGLFNKRSRKIPAPLGTISGYKASIELTARLQCIVGRAAPFMGLQSTVNHAIGAIAQTHGIITHNIQPGCDHRGSLTSPTINDIGSDRV